MSEKQPYQIIKYQHITEKAMMLQRLASAESNPSVRACKSPKYVFIVDCSANKQEIAQALEKMYQKNNIKVVNVNTINVRPKARRVRGRSGFKKAFKKAIVTLRPDDSLDDV